MTWLCYTKRHVHLLTGLDRVHVSGRFMMTSILHADTECITIPAINIKYFVVKVINPHNNISLRSFEWNIDTLIVGNEIVSRRLIQESVPRHSGLNRVSFAEHPGRNSGVYNVKIVISSYSNLWDDHHYKVEIRGESVLSQSEQKPTVFLISIIFLLLVYCIKLLLHVMMIM